MSSSSASNANQAPASQASAGQLVPAGPLAPATSNQWLARAQQLQIAPRTMVAMDGNSVIVRTPGMKMTSNVKDFFYNGNVWDTRGEG